VDSDDEYGRHAYLFRNQNASDDEEFDNALNDGQDEYEIEGKSDDEDAYQSRIRSYIRQHGSG
jgi:hypothetical protein